MLVGRNVLSYYLHAAGKEGTELKSPGPANHQLDRQLT